MPRSKIIVSASVGFLMVIGLTLTAFAKDKKQEQTLKNATGVLQVMAADKAISKDALASAKCVIILPGVKKFAVGVGASEGRGPMSCRGGKDFSGHWSAPAILDMSGGSAGLQLGGSSTDFVLLVMSPAVAQKILSGETKVGSDMTAAAGPGATATTPVGNSDVLTYARAKGVFAGVSLDGAKLAPDPSANSSLYGKYTSAQDIVLENKYTPTTAGLALISELENKVGKP